MKQLNYRIYPLKTKKVTLANLESYAGAVNYV